MKVRVTAGDSRMSDHEEAGHQVEQAAHQIDEEACPMRVAQIRGTTSNSPAKSSSHPMNITETMVMTSALPMAMVPKMMSATPMNRNQPRWGSYLFDSTHRYK